MPSSDFPQREDAIFAQTLMVDYSSQLLEAFVVDAAILFHYAIVYSI